jgi:hypothetical protein
MTTTANKIVLAATAGAVVFTIVELAQAAKAAQIVKMQGVTVSLAGARVPLRPPSGGGGIGVELPPKAEAITEHMHKRAAIAAAAAVVVIALIV